MFAGKGGGPAGRLLRVTVYVSLNILLNIANKWVMTEELPFPVTIVFAGKAFNFLLAGTLFTTGALKWTSISDEGWKFWSLIIGNGVVHGAAAALQNIAINHQSIVLNQIIKCTAPIPTLILSAMLERRRYGTNVVLLTLVIVLGAVLGLDNPNLHLYGFAVSASSTLCGSIEMVLVGKVLSEHSMSSLQLILLTTPGAFVSIFPTYFIMEHEKVIHLSSSELGELVVWSTVLSSVALIYSFSHFYLIEHDGSHYASIVGTGKILLLVVASKLIFKDYVSIKNALGLFLCLVSLFWYSVTKEKEGEPT